jgi:hypothetical protein
MAKSKATLKTLYLYADGHGVGIFEEKHDKSGTSVEWVEIFEKVMPTGYLHFYGSDESRHAYRVVLSHGLIGLVQKAKGLEIWENNSSEASKEKGIHIKTIHLYMKEGNVSIHDVYQNGTGLCSCDFFLQTKLSNPDINYPTFEETIKATSWGFQKLNITAVHRVEKAPVS